MRVSLNINYVLLYKHMRVREIDGIYISDTGLYSKKKEGPWRKGSLCPCHVSIPHVYYRVRIGTEFKYIHRLVARAFVHNPRPGVFLFVDHINHVKLDNNATNLRWLTHQLNTMNRALVPKAYKVWRVKKYQAKFTAQGVTYRTKYCATKLEAEQLAMTMKADKFKAIYLSHLKENDEDSQKSAHKFISGREPDPTIQFELHHTSHCRDMRRRPSFHLVPCCVSKNFAVFNK